MAKWNDGQLANIGKELHELGSQTAAYEARMAVVLPMLQATGQRLDPHFTEIECSTKDELYCVYALRAAGFNKTAMIDESLKGCQELKAFAGVLQMPCKLISKQYDAPEDPNEALKRLAENMKATRDTWHNKDR